MAIERRINSSELDFDQIKANLVAYMKATDTTFNDYNYEGSAMSTIIDVLSIYNTCKFNECKLCFE